MDHAAARERLAKVLKEIDEWGIQYTQNKSQSIYDRHESRERVIKRGRDVLGGQVRIARELIAALGEDKLASQVADDGSGYPHPYSSARTAIFEAIAVIDSREELAGIIGPAGPKLAASELHHLNGYY